MVFTAGEHWQKDANCANSGVAGWSITGEHGPADAGGAREVPQSEQPQD
jgi:hypothetical protein